MTEEELNARMFELNKLVLRRFIEEHLSEEEIDGILKEIRNETDRPTDSEQPVSGDSPHRSIQHG